MLSLLSVCKPFSLSHIYIFIFFAYGSRWTPLMVARSWHRNWLEGILSRQPEGRIRILPSQHISLPMMSIMRIARLVSVTYCLSGALLLDLIET